MSETEPRIEFGLRAIEDIPWGDLNVLTQTRKTYAEDGIEELMRSIEALDSAGVPRNELLHPVLVNVLEPADASDYLDALNLCHKTEHTLDELHPNTDGKYVVVIAGHRRRLAIGMILDKQGVGPYDATVASNVRYGLGFSEALRLQIQENTHIQLPVHEIARAIQATYNYGIATGAYTSVADCVKDLPFGEEKVRNALRFCELPDYLQDWVEDNHLSYGCAVALYPLKNALEKHYEDKEPADRDSIVNDRLKTEAMGIMNNGWGRDMVAARVREFIEAMDAEAAQANNLQLFQMDAVVMARQARNRAYHSLFASGLNRMRSFVSIAPHEEMFRQLPAEQQEAIIDELITFLQKLGGITTARTGFVEEVPPLFRQVV